MDDHIKILVFGNLTEIVGTHELIFFCVTDTDSLVKKLYDKYENLKNQVFSIAINRIIISQNSIIDSRDEVALLPPFSGG